MVTRNDINLNNKPERIKSSCSPFDYQLKNEVFEFDGIKYPQRVSLHLNKTINFNCLNSEPQIHKILLWNLFLTSVDFGFGLGVKEPFIRNSCPVTNCEVFNNHTRLNEADLVIVHVLNKIPTIPKKRPLNQRWIFMIFESQIHSPNFSKYNNVFNLTSTHGLESTFSRLIGTYQLFEWALNENFDDSRDFSAGKSDLAVAVISNCRSSSGRLEYIKELKKYIPVNIFGKCGGIRCEDFYKTKSNAYCKDLVSKTHKFYFSFENSICDGYITEKFFVSLKYDIVPVVLGGGNYTYFVSTSNFKNLTIF
ncbi:alpha-(1-3)-fucosyltransferase C-like [Brachionus plicatilis]|uniref:Fucosyltransferase n=1 Tax=Brachionus plicatilis TaxID=10195 RepID=A0A3M7SQ18_BRAPC|nr:alpha-(1-3)-fucosyltransferase C-like [Brachionus plicatilis]